MNTHNAPLTPKGREAMVRCVEAGLSKAAAAARQFNTTPKTVAKWVERFRAGGVDGLRYHSSRPLSLPSQTAPATCFAAEALRRQRCMGKQIAMEVGVSPATISRILRRPGLNRLSALEPAEPVLRCEREHPCENPNKSRAAIARDKREAFAQGSTLVRRSPPSGESGYDEEYSIEAGLLRGPCHRAARRSVGPQ